MSAPAAALRVALAARARQSLGSSHEAIYGMVAAALQRHARLRRRLVDVGCGTGRLLEVIGADFGSYCGLDAVRYDAFPAGAEFHLVDLDAAVWPDLPSGDAVVALETIEHLENPWAFMRQLAGLAVPDGLVIVTTPNQLSLLSLVTLAARQRFSAFGDSQFPAHRTALLESDLARAAGEAGLDIVEIGYTRHGRLPLTPWHYPAAIAAVSPRLLSDNLMLVARRPHV